MLNKLDSSMWVMLCALLPGTMQPCFGADPVQPHAPAGATNASSSSFRVPLSFEPNRGQTHSDVRYLSRGPGYIVYLTQQEVVLTLHRDGVAKSKTEGFLKEPETSAKQGEFDVLRLSMIGAHPDPRIQGQTDLSGKTHYILGSDRSRWHTHVPNFAQVKYNDVYPGIDLVFYGTDQGKLEYDFILHPGADVGDIQLGFEGNSQPLRLDNKGDLVVSMSNSEIIQRAPTVYQLFGDDRRIIPARYVLSEDGQVAFHVSDYDSQRPLIIDPVIAYSTYLGDSGDSGRDIVVTPTGETYVTGFTSSLDFPTTAGALQGELSGQQDAFVLKLNSDGTEILYSTFLGGSDDETSGGSIGPAIAVDRIGNVFITGRTGSADFPTVNAIQPVLEGLVDIFVAKLNRDGSELVYSTYLGAGRDDPASVAAGPSIAIDMTGSAFVMGHTRAIDHPTVNAIQPFNAGGMDTFLLKLDGRGSSIIFWTYLGGSSDDKGRGIAVDFEGNAYVTGRTDSVDFPTANPLQATQAGRGDIFVSKFTPDGSALSYSTYIGGTNTDKGRAITVDRDGNAYVTGNTQSSNFPVLSPIQAQSAGGGDAFVAKLNPEGSAFIYSTYVGGSGDDLGAAIAVDALGSVYISGSTDSIDFPVRRPFQVVLGGGLDAFVLRLNQRGTAVSYASYLGGTGDDASTGVAVDRSGNSYLVGSTDSVDFPIVGALQLDVGGIFVTKVDPSSTP